MGLRLGARGQLPGSSHRVHGWASRCGQLSGQLWKIEGFWGLRDPSSLHLEGLPPSLSLLTPPVASPLPHPCS